MKTAKILCRSCYRRAAALNLLFAAVGGPRAILYTRLTRLYEGYTVYPRAAGAARPNTEREPRNRARAAPPRGAGGPGPTVAALAAVCNTYSRQSWTRTWLMRLPNHGRHISSVIRWVETPRQLLDSDYQHCSFRYNSHVRRLGCGCRCGRQSAPHRLQLVQRRQ